MPPPATTAGTLQNTTLAASPASRFSRNLQAKQRAVVAYGGDQVPLIEPPSSVRRDGGAGGGAGGEKLVGLSESQLVLPSISMVQ